MGKMKTENLKSFFLTGFWCAWIIELGIRQKCVCTNFFKCLKAKWVEMKVAKNSVYKLLIR